MESDLVRFYPVGKYIILRVVFTQQLAVLFIASQHTENRAQPSNLIYLAWVLYSKLAIVCVGDSFDVRASQELQEMR